jgi:predicted RNA binding protein YcfA (HicA-like mRNA interferase family)
MKLPQVSGSDVVRALGKVGFTLRRQHGGHMILRRDNPLRKR